MASKASGFIIHDTWTFCSPILNAHTHAPKHSYVVPYNKHTFLKINITASKFVFSFWVCVIYIVEQTSKYRQFMHTTDLVLLMLKNSMIKAQKYLENLWQRKVIALWVRNFRTLKNKYDLTLCQSCLHAASKIFIRHKKNLDRVRFFCVFPIRAKNLQRWFDSSESPYSQNPERRLSNSSTSSQSTVYRSLHTEFTETGGLPLNMWL